MTEYWLIHGDCAVTRSNAISVYEVEEEAVKDTRSFREEILAGVYDEEWCIEPEERETMANDVYLYEVLRGNGGIRRMRQIEV